ncbi:related to putative S-adenosylmethionine-dependent methyltransferase of the seven beta-strand family [Sporisorium reilianum f. sp. reilianum]|uniref:Related to putative S-adenosylmethionine-dependent methyltransferase of the seven beta-strand family n=1 Tax=Sporisorium reilianum f. sp. reilianum TaxID=72559 RepID=A0A2N8UAE1_9BASI|nr:related to putative S-adenosylmethionine-dependent methyltransferase of the seven beta-strand family [Sporisorium reilianum f. sp. reilianum]
MTIDTLAARVNPTSCLPRIKDEPCSTDVFRALAHLSRLYSPQSLNNDVKAFSLSLEAEEDDLAGRAQSAYQDALDSARVDDNEKRYAMSWLTRLIGSGLFWVDDETPVTCADALLDLAGRILGGHASLEEAGAISREFRFPLEDPVLIPQEDAASFPPVLPTESIEIVLRDDPLPPSDTQSEANSQNGTGSSQDAAAAVGVQTWGASIVVSDVLVRHPALFHPWLAGGSDLRLRIAELGAGTGLLGMAAAKLLQQKDIAADVVLTDYHTQVLRNLKHNVDENFATSTANTVSVTVEHLDWLEIHQQRLQGAALSDQPKYDLILLADVIYAPEHAAWIRSSIEALLRKPSFGQVAEAAPRAHIIMAVRGTGKFQGLSRTVEAAFRPDARPSTLPSLSASRTATPLDTMPGTPALMLEPASSVDHNGDAKHSDLLRSRMDAITVMERGAQLLILKRRRLDKRSNVGRNDEQEYLWFEIGWVS